MDKPRSFPLSGMWAELVIVTGIILGLTIMAHCATTSSAKHSNSLGVMQYQENPFAYMYGSVADGTVMADKGKEGTSVRFKPAHTYSLYDESVLFCGNVADMFPRGAIVVTYRKQASALLQGIPCHELVSVDRIAGKVPQ